MYMNEKNMISMDGSYLKHSTLSTNQDVIMKLGKRASRSSIGRERTGHAHEK